MMKLDHIAINVKNIEDAASWYTQNLGAETIYSDSSWAMLKVGSTKIALTVASQHPPHLGFCVGSIDEIPCDEPKYHRDGSAYHYIEDPDGNVIEYVYYPE